MQVVLSTVKDKNGNMMVTGYSCTPDGFQFTCYKAIRNDGDYKEFTNSSLAWKWLTRAPGRIKYRYRRKTKTYRQFTRRRRRK